MDEKRIQKLAKIFELSNDGLSRREFLDAFAKIVKDLTRWKEQIMSSIDYKEQDERKKLNALKEEFNQTVKKTEQKLDILIQNTLDNIDKKLSSLKNGKDADEDKIIKSVLDKIRLPEDGKPADEDKIVDTVLGKIEIPQTDEARFKALEDRIEEYGRNKLRFGGGGFSKIAMDGHIIDWTTFGTGDGTTTDFTLPTNPNPASSLEIMVGGGQLFLTDDYTVSGLTVSFTVAPPSGAKIRYKCRN